jgi:N-acetyl-anhydromuramyl-L-alanine amidase AmpD
VLRNGGIRVVKDGVATDLVVSNHYYIDKDGNISQFVQDKDIAFHAGICNWVVDGEQIADKKATVNNQEVSACNALSIAVTLSNRNDGVDTYTALQYDALLTLTRFLVTKYDVPQSQLVRSSDITSKQPLNGFPQWSRFVSQVYT